MDIRSKFVEAFGEDQAAAIEAAAEGHQNGVNSGNKGPYFQWALLIAIGYQCMEIDSYREHHGITSPWSELKPWIIANAELNTYQGDLDYLALMVGTYNEYMPQEAVAEVTQS